jgi:small subunit ribosomal protein S17
MQQENIRTQKAVVTGRSGDKSIKVAIDYVLRHPKYGKFMKRRTVLNVHDQDNKAGIGDLVEITPCRPHSKLKRWRLVRIVKKAVAK